MKKIMLLLLAIAMLSGMADAQGTTARAIANLDMLCSQADGSGNFTFCMNVYIYPTSGGNVQLQKVIATIAPGDTQATVLSNITTAIVNAATGAGYTVARSAILVPQYVRGQ